jgi:hypothetical protein
MSLGKTLDVNYVRDNLKKLEEEAQLKKWNELVAKYLS